MTNSRLDEAFDWYEGFYLPDDVVFTENLYRALAGEELPLPGADYDFRSIDPLDEWLRRVTFISDASEASIAKYRNPKNWTI